MKKVLFNTILIFCVLLSFTSCRKNNTDKNDINNDKNQYEINLAKIDTQITKSDNIEIDNEAIGGSLNTCIHASVFNDSFHSFSVELIKHVTSEKFDEWINLDHKVTNECPYYGVNIYEFIKYFNISKDVFSDLYYNTSTYYNHDYNINLLYSDNVDEIYKYYENGGNYEEFKKRSLDHAVKIDLTSYIGDAQYSEWKEKNGYSSVISWSIPEIIYEFDISQDTLKSIVAIYKNPDILEPEVISDDNAEIIEITKSYDYDYDYDKIYNHSDELIKLINEDFPSYMIDEIIRK